MQLEVREGRASDNSITLYPAAVHEAGPNVEMTKKEGPVIAQMIMPGVTKLWWELMWPEGLYRQTESGNTDKAETTFKIEYRRIGDTTWITRVDMTKSASQQGVYRQSWAQDVAVSATGWES